MDAKTLIVGEGGLNRGILADEARDSALEKKCKLNFIQSPTKLQGLSLRKGYLDRLQQMWQVATAFSWDSI